MLNKNAEYYEEEVEMAVQSFMAMLEPMIIIVLAAIVGVLIGAVMAPMLAMYQGLDNL
jgi:type IV pilus assembly protein PilC